jgi:hypothetical protein
VCCSGSCLERGEPREPRGAAMSGVGEDVNAAEEAGEAVLVGLWGGSSCVVELQGLQD